jgi:DNA-binding CsgD family transcriptional regulator
MAERFDVRESYARAHNAIGSALIVSGNQEEGARVLESGISYASRTGQPRQAVSMRGNLGTASGEMFEFDTAEPALLRAIEEARNADLDGQFSYTLSWLALVQLYRGRWNDAVRSARTAIDTPHAYGISTMMAFLALGRVRARRGDPDVWQALDEALRQAKPTGTLQRLAPVSAARAEARWLDGDRAGTMAEAQRAHDLALAHRHPWHMGELTYWLRMAGVDVPLPGDVAEPWSLHLTGDFAGAASAWERRDCPYEAARARFDSDEIEQLRAALTAFDALGAQPMAARAAQRLRELGATAIPRGPRKTTRDNPAGLTARELDVLELLAAGSTYAEIGAALFISTRTVEHHVSSILRKLGASTRRDAVRISTERGIIPT